MSYVRHSVWKRWDKGVGKAAFLLETKGKQTTLPEGVALRNPNSPHPYILIDKYPHQEVMEDSPASGHRRQQYFTRVIFTR